MLGSSKLTLDVFERALWTGAEGALSVLATTVADVSLWWAVPVAALIAAAKGWIAGRIGRKGTASTLPEAKDPATPPAVTGAPAPDTSGTYAG